MLQWGHDFSAVEMSSLDEAEALTKKLQWGHDFSAVEIATKSLMNALLLELQWGHDFSAVEMPPRRTLSPQLWSSFNGATTFQPWKYRAEAGL